MAGLFEQIASSLSRSCDSFEVRVANASELQAAFKLREEVFGEELRRTKEQSSSPPAEKDAYDKVSTTVVGIDKKSKAVVGTFRLTPAEAMASDPALVEQYHLDYFPKPLLEKTVVLSRLCLLKEYRKTPVSNLLYEFAYRSCVQSNKVIGILICEPNLYSLYRILGFRPLGHPHRSDFGGYRLPLFILFHDYEHLKACNSPFHTVAEQLQFPEDTMGLDWFSEQNKSFMFVDPGFSLIEMGDTQSLDIPLFRGISPEGKKNLLEHAMKIHCNPGDMIIEKNAGGRTFGFIKNGLAEVRTKDDILSILGPGDLFGEIAFLLETPRTADVVAAVKDTEVILLSLSCLKRLSTKDDGMIFWQNMSKILAKRLATMARYRWNDDDT